jgi:hypothetical protein
MNLEEAVITACQESTLVKALSWIAVWESERVIAQAIKAKKSLSMAAQWDTCFEVCFKAVIYRWDRLYGTRG